MDKIMELGDVFDVGAINLVLLIPVVFVVIGAIGLFVYGFKQSDSSPTFRKIGIEVNSTSLKRKKRNDAATIVTSLSRKKTEIAASKTVKTVVQQQIQERQQQQIQSQQPRQQKLSKKDNSSPKVSAAATTRRSSSKGTAAAAIKSGPATTPAKSRDNAYDGNGEWKTVFTKKQKKMATDALPQVTAEEVSSIASTNKIKKIDKHAKKENIPSKQQAVEELTLQLSIKNKKSKLEATTALAASQQTSLELNAEGVEALTKTSIVVNSIAFDELGDDSWTNRKPQKKKKRAVRE